MSWSLLYVAIAHDFSVVFYRSSMTAVSPYTEPYRHSRCLCICLQMTQHTAFLSSPPLPNLCFYRNQGASNYKARSTISPHRVFLNEQQPPMLPAPNRGTPNNRSKSSNSNVDTYDHFTPAPDTSIVRLLRIVIRSTPTQPDEERNPHVCLKHHDVFTRPRSHRVCLTQTERN